MIRRIFLLLLLGLFSQISFSQDFDKAILDSYFKALETNNKFMGSIAVSRNGEIIYTKVLGFADVEKGIKANSATKYRIGSISKTYTTVLVFKAVEENKLKLDETILSYFPTVPNANKISIKHLLSHRSGIHNFTADPDYMSYNTQAKTQKEMVDIIARAESEFEPGSKMSYSNSNFVLLTYILEKAFNKNYKELIKEYITNPLGLKNTYLGGKISVANNECYSYRFVEKWNIEPETDTSIPLGAGGIVASPSDLVKFSDALFTGKLLKPESLELMKTMLDNFGLGLFPIPFYERVGLGHNGGIDGFSSVFACFPNDKVSYALTSNGSNFNTNDISIAVLSAVFNKPYSISEFTSYSISAAELDQYLGVYASSDIPLKITITKVDSHLVAQATGQGAFPLEAFAKNKFKFDQAGVVMEFNPEKKTMVLKQGGGQFNFKIE